MREWIFKASFLWNFRHEMTSTSIRRERVSRCWVVFETFEQLQFYIFSSTDASSLLSELKHHRINKFLSNPGWCVLCFGCNTISSWPCLGMDGSSRMWSLNKFSIARSMRNHKVMQWSEDELLRHLKTFLSWLRTQNWSTNEKSIAKFWPWKLCFSLLIVEEKNFPIHKSTQVLRSAIC